MPSVQAANPSIKVGFFPLPGSNVAANNVPNVEPNLTYAVLKNARDKAAAIKWLAFLSQPQNYDPFVDTQGGSTTETGGKFSGFTANVMGSWAGKGFLQGNVFPPLPAVGPYYDEAANWPALQLDIVQGSKTPQQVAASYQAGWAKVIGK
jgi:raffinose/stachyose/melibiose transport system substrate-binding protein